MNVPWIISGSGIIKGRLIEQPVTISDTAPTIARILGIQPPVLLDRTARAGGL